MLKSKITAPKKLHVKILNILHHDALPNEECDNVLNILATNFLMTLLVK